MLRYLFVCLAAGFAAAAAAKDFSSWRKHSQGELISESRAFAPGSRAMVGLRIRLEDGWHTYWSNPGDSGTALRLRFNNSAGVKVSRVLVPFPKRFETGPLISFGWEKEVLFPVELELDRGLKPGSRARIEVDAEWLVCEDVCIPAVDNLKLEVPVTGLDGIEPSDHFPLFQRARGQIPMPAPEPARYEMKTDSAVLRVMKWSSDRDFVDFFPFKNSGVTNEAPEVKSGAGELELTLRKSNVPQAGPERTGVLVSRRKDGVFEAWQFGESGWSFEQNRANSAAGDLWWMLISAFLGGLILNLMPCVFPVLSIKLLSLMKLVRARPGEVRAHNAAYVAGVLVSFLLIAGVLSGLRSAGHLIGWGFQLQSPVFVSLLCWLFFALSLNLLGLFEMDFLNAGFGHRLTRFGGLSGSFFTGVLAVVVASPCTAPFMGVALGFGLAQPTGILAAIFLALGLGLAFPYIVFAVFPAWIRVLPKPGVWMVRLKQAMAFPLLLTLVWLLWVLGEVRGPTSVAVVMASCLSFGFALWLAAWRRLAGVVFAALTLVGALNFVYRAEKLAGNASAGPDVWQPYSPALLESLKGKNVFVNMTADWCLTCKVNERLIFNDPEILALLQAKNVTMVKGDWTQRNEEITLFLDRFERVGVPFYVLYSPRHPGGQILPEVMSKSSFKDWIERVFP